MAGSKRSYSEAMLTAACAAIADADNDAIAGVDNDATAGGPQSRRRRSARHNPSTPVSVPGAAACVVAGADRAVVDRAGVHAGGAAAGPVAFGARHGGNADHEHFGSAHGRRSARLHAALLGSIVPGNGGGDGGGGSGGDGACNSLGGRDAGGSAARGAEQNAKDVDARAGRRVSFDGVFGVGRDSCDPDGADARNHRSGNPGGGGEAAGAGAAPAALATRAPHAEASGRRVHGGGLGSGRTRGAHEPNRPAGPSGSLPPAPPRRVSSPAGGDESRSEHASMGCVVMAASAGDKSSAAGAEIPSSDDEFLPQRPAAAARLARLERVVDSQEQQHRERLARIDRAERMEIDAAIAASSAVAASDAAERMVREVEEGEESEEEQPMVGQTSAAAGPVHPPDITPMDLEAVRARTRAQRGPAPLDEHARWRDPVRRAAAEAWLARSQSQSDRATRADGVAGERDNAPPPVNGGTKSAAHPMWLANGHADPKRAACAHIDGQQRGAAELDAAVERDLIDGGERAASPDVDSAAEVADVLTPREAEIRASLAVKRTGRGRSRGRGGRGGTTRPPLGGDAPVHGDGAAGRGRGRSWSHAEKVSVSRAWLAVTRDPILGTDQTSAAFYAAVVVAYRRLFRLPTGWSPRSEAAVVRFMRYTLFKNVQLVSSVYTRVCRRNLTGNMTEEDLIRATAAELDDGDAYEALQADPDHDPDDPEPQARARARGFRASDWIPSWRILRTSDKFSGAAAAAALAAPYGGRGASASPARGRERSDAGGAAAAALDGC